MQRTEKSPKRSGPIVVLGVLVLAVLAAAGTWMRYSSENPSTTRGHLKADRTVLAFFSPPAAKQIRPGMRAVVTVSGRDSKKFEGRVSAVHEKPALTEVSVELDAPVEAAAPDSECQVTVDTSIPPEVLKQP